MNSDSFPRSGSRRKSLVPMLPRGNPIPTALVFGSDLQRLDYQWDLVGNLTQRQDRSTAKTLTETFTYDRLNRLTSWTTGGKTDRYAYDGLGNITAKTGVGNYIYGQNGAGIHAVTYTSGDKASYRYDANGNMTSGGGHTLSYNTFDKPLSISKGGHTTAFHYDVDRSRYWRKDTTKDGKVTTTHYIGNVEVITHPNGEKETKRYINGVVIDTQTKKANGSTSNSVQLLLKDHLGSTHTILLNSSVEPNTTAS